MWLIRGIAGAALSGRVACSTELCSGRAALRYLERMDDAGETNARVAGTTPRTGRLRVLAVLAALGLLYFPGLGAVDLASAIVGLPSRDELVGMRAAYGLVIGFLLPATLFLLAARPTGTAAAVQQVLVVAVAFLLTAVASGLWTALVGGGGLLVLGAALGRLAPGGPGVPRAASDIHETLKCLSTVFALPLAETLDRLLTNLQSISHPPLCQALAEFRQKNLKQRINCHFRPKRCNVVQKNRPNNGFYL